MATGELLLRNGTIIDPGNNINAINDLLIRDGVKNFTEIVGNKSLS